MNQEVAFIGGGSFSLRTEGSRTSTDHCRALYFELQLKHATKRYSAKFLDEIVFLADFFQQVAYMAVGMTQRGLVSFAMLLSSFYSKAELIL